MKDLCIRMAGLKVLSEKNFLYHSVFPLTYMCVDIDFVSLGIKKLKRFLWDIKKIYTAFITFFSELSWKYSVINGYSNPTDDN